MTIEMTPPATSPWHEIYPVPKPLRLEDGPWCSMDTTTALVPELRGWLCPVCLAWWDLDGRHGRWVADSPVIEGLVVADTTAAVARLRRIDRAATGAILAGAVLGGGFAAGRALRPYADLVPEALLWAVSLMVIGLVLTGCGLLLAWRWWTSHTGGGAA